MKRIAAEITAELKMLKQELSCKDALKTRNLRLIVVQLEKEIALIEEFWKNVVRLGLSILATWISVDDGYWLYNDKTKYSPRNMPKRLYKCQFLHAIYKKEVKNLINAEEKEVYHEMTSRIYTLLNVHYKTLYPILKLSKFAKSYEEFNALLQRFNKLSSNTMKDTMKNVFLKPRIIAKK